MAALQQSGVVGGAQNQLNPTLDTSGRNILIDTGTAMLRGFCFENTSSTATSIPAASSQNRIDRLVLRLNRGASTVSTFVVPTVITGTPAASPVEPALTRTTGGLWDLPVCSWTSASNGALTGLTDERQFGGFFQAGVSGSRPVLTTPGLFYESDTGRLMLYDGSAWDVVTAPGDTWHNLTPLSNSFSAGSNGNVTRDTPQYRLLAGGAVALRGTVLTPSSGQVTGLNFASVPGAYQPAGARAPQAVVADVNGDPLGIVYIQPDGNMQFGGPGITGSNAYNIVIDSVILIS